jgi:ABC-type glycerol-3-phosphate transport system substrate-binding protein
MSNIDRNSPIPIYHQLKTLIREKVESGVWRPGDSIPTEQRLCQLFGISRSPVRQALNELAYEGLLVRRPGLGTFVRDETRGTSALETSIPIMTSDPAWPRVLDRVSDAWNGEHPRQRISFDVNIVDHGQFYNLLTTAVGGGTAPNVAMVDSVWVAGLAQSGFLYDLQADLGTQWDYEECLARLYPAFVEANSVDGRLYALPLKADVSLLWYRKDWFAQEGLGPPGNWNELLDVTAYFLRPQVRERYGLTYPLAFPGGKAAGESTVYNLMSFVWSAGGEIIDPGTGKVVLDSAETRRALQFLRELVTQRGASSPDIVNYRWDTTPWLFASGQVAMALGGSYQGELILETSGWDEGEFAERVECAPTPAAPDGGAGNQVSTVGGTSYVILRQCRQPELVMDVLQTAVSHEVVGELYRSMLQSSPSSSFNAFFNPDTDPLLARISAMIASGRARPSIPEYFRVSYQLQAMFEAAISGSTPVDEITRRTAEFVCVISGRDLGRPERE